MNVLREGGGIVRVLLLQSYLGQRTNEPLVFPLGLAYLASTLKNSHDVFCFDPNVSNNPPKEIISILQKFDPEVVGLSLRNLDNVFSFNKRSYYPVFRWIVKQIKAVKPNCKLIAGGAGFSIFAEEVMIENPEIDFGVLSEGENSFQQLFMNFEHPEKVPNLIYRKDGKTIVTEKKAVEFETLPFPSRELFDVKKYNDASYSIGVQSKRGCAFNCIFCSNRVHGGSACRLRSPKSVVDEIEVLVDDFGVSSCFFVDSTFNFPLAHCREICEEMIKRKMQLKWSADFRPDYLNEYTMKLCVQAGCSWFSFSPDAASDQAMKVLGKNFGIQQLEKTFLLARKIDGAKVGYSFLYDLPFYNKENTWGLLRIVPKIMFSCGSKLRYVTFSRIRIYPRTTFYKIALKQGKIYANTNLLYPTYYKSGSSFTIESFLPQVLRDSVRLLTKSYQALDY